MNSYKALAKDKNVCIVLNWVKKWASFFHYFFLSSFIGNQGIEIEKSFIIFKLSNYNYKKEILKNYGQYQSSPYDVSDFYIQNGSGTYKLKVSAQNCQNNCTYSTSSNPYMQVQKEYTEMCKKFSNIGLYPNQGTVAGGLRYKYLDLQIPLSQMHLFTLIFQTPVHKMKIQGFLQKV